MAGKGVGGLRERMSFGIGRRKRERQLDDALTPGLKVKNKSRRRQQQQQGPRERLPTPDSSPENPM